MRASSVITYEDAGAGSGHALKAKDPEAALAQVESFMQACAAPGARVESHVELAGPDAFVHPLRERFVGAYGKPSAAMRWAIPAADVAALAALIASLRPLPVLLNEVVPVCLHLDYRFHFRSADGPAELPGQGASSYMHFVPAPGRFLGESELHARISEKSSVSVFFNFPFETASPAFARYRDFVQAHLPFRFAPSHFRRWTLTKQGDGFASHRLA